MMERTISLADSLPLEQERVRELISLYDQIPAGVFAARMMRESLRRAEVASASGDVVAMIRAYKDLSEYQ